MHERTPRARKMMHKAREHHQTLDLYPLRALWVPRRHDSVSHIKLWVTMMDMGYPLHLIDLLAKLYRKHLAEVNA